MYAWRLLTAPSNGSGTLIDAFLIDWLKPEQSWTKKDYDLGFLVISHLGSFYARLSFSYLEATFWLLKFHSSYDRSSTVECHLKSNSIGVTSTSSLLSFRMPWSKYVSDRKALCCLKTTKHTNSSGTKTSVWDDHPLVATDGIILFMPLAEPMHCRSSMQAVGTGALWSTWNMTHRWRGPKCRTSQQSGCQNIFLLHMALDAFSLIFYVASKLALEIDLCPAL